MTRSMMTGRYLSRLAICAVLAGAGESCATPGGPPIHQIAPEINATLLPARRTLGPGDEIEVAFAPGELGDWSHTVIVRPDGFAAFLAIDELEVYGRTPKELGAELTRAYESVTDQPKLSVSVLNWAPRTFSILGEVRRPGSYPVDPHTSLPFAEALALAEGVRHSTAYLANTVFVRWDPATRKQVSWTVDARERYWGQPETVFLQPFDLIYIPNTPVDKLANQIEAYLRVIIPIPRVFVPAV